MKVFLSYCIWPIIMLASVVSIEFCLRTGVEDEFIPIFSVAPWVGLIYILERIFPEKEAQIPLDQPIYVDFLHYMFAVNLGSYLAMNLVDQLAEFLRSILGLDGFLNWPTSWPIVFQIIWMLVLSEVISYWQHRMYHSIPALWPLHRLHHQGEHLNLVRAGRFHIFDVAIGTVCAVIPLYVLGVTREMLIWYVCLNGVFGALQHSNIKIRTLPWIDLILCTPAVHRHHHSVDVKEGNSNFGTYIMIFDHIFGSYGKARQEGPSRIGVANFSYGNRFY